MMRSITLIALTLPLTARADLIRIQSGMLSGTSGKSADVRVYKAIPYAAPPVGNLRWKPPQPAALWEGTRHAAQFSATCMQTQYPATSIYRSAPQPISEDCLYLNVWTGALSSKERRPVMVWIHGGGFTRGSGSTPTYDGEALAKRGVVVVTINYRLGVFGFFAHPELSKESPRHSSGNYALLDQIAALQWVQKNIGAFGGDPKRVTIFGESAGSWAVNLLMATPLAKGLFHRAIGESGGVFSPMRTLAEVEKTGEQFAASQQAKGIADLRAKPADDLLKAASIALPNVDGWVLPKDVYSLFTQGKYNQVPLIAGFNADEGTALAPWPDNATSDRYIQQVRRTFGSTADEFLKIYPARSDAEAKSAHYHSFRDQRFGWQMRTWARLAGKSGHTKSYFYYFTRIPPGLMSERLRAYHAAEIQYVFGNLSGARPWDDADRKLSETMSSYWVNFAATGNPNGKGLPKWPEYDAKTDMAIEFGNAVELRRAINKEGLDFFDRYYESQRSANRTATVRERTN